MSNLISQTQAAEHFGLPRHIVPKLLNKVKPAYDNGAKTGRVVIYNMADIEPILQAEVDRRKAKAATAAPPPVADTSATIAEPDVLKAQLRAVFGAVEIVRHRLEEVVRDSAENDFRVGVIFDRTSKLIEAMEAQAKLNEADASFKRSAAAGWFTNQQALKDMRSEAGDWNTALNQRLDRVPMSISNLDAALNQRLDRLQTDMDGIKSTIETLSGAVSALLARPTPLPMPEPRYGVAKLAEHPSITPYTGPVEIVAPVTITTGPAFVEPKLKRRALVLGVTDGQRQAIKQEVGDAWELEFFEGTQRYNGKFATALDKAEFMVVMNSFRGNGPEGLAKEASKPCYRAAGTRGIVELLIEKL